MLRRLMVRSTIATSLVTSLATMCLVTAAPRSRPPGSATLARSAFKILTEHCGRCHGEKGRYKEDFYINRSAMLRDHKVIPGEPRRSVLFLNVRNGAMPINGPKLDEPSIAVIRRWIEAGAPDWR